MPGGGIPRLKSFHRIPEHLAIAAVMLMWRAWRLLETGDYLIFVKAAHFARAAV